MKLRKDSIELMCKTWSLLQGIEVPVEVYMLGYEIQLRLPGGNMLFRFNTDPRSKLIKPRAVFSILDKNVNKRLDDEKLCDVFEKYQDEMKYLREKLS